MKKIAIIVLFLSINSSVFPQFWQPQQNQGQLDGGMGVNFIDGEAFYNIRVRPEFAFANWGLGLDLNLEFNSEGLRPENFLTLSDYLSIIRYVRYGSKSEPVYAKVGALDYTTLGYGNIMYMYNNSPSFDARTIGLNTQLDFGVGGVELVYGDFAQAGVLGVRGFVRPLQFTALNNIPIISGLKIGASFATDLNENAKVKNGIYVDSTSSFTTTEHFDKPQVVSADLGLPLFKNDLLDWEVYYTYSKIINFGDGQAYGTILGLDFKVATVNIKLERTLNNAQYLPSYFNAQYEIERFNYTEGGWNSKLNTLSLSDVSDADGYYGGIFVRLLGAFDIIGSYQRMEKIENSGTLTMFSQVAPENAPFVLRAGYDKVKIKDEADMFKLDERSLFFVETGYKPYPFLIVSMVYNWTFAPIRGADDEILGYQTQKRIEPKVSFVYPFNF